MGQPKEKIENKWTSRGLEEEARRTYLREKEKTNGLVGAKNRGMGQANLRKKEKKIDEYGLKTGGGVGQP